MRQWETSTRLQQCGGCGRKIAEGEPALVIAIGPVQPQDGLAPMAKAYRSTGWSVTKIRCEGCAGEPANLTSGFTQVGR